MSKKKEGEKAKSGEPEEDMSNQIFYNSFCKRSKEYGIPVSPQITEEYNRTQESEGSVEDVQLTEPIGWQGAKALSYALTDSKFPHLKSLKMIKCGIEDEGVRVICKYLALRYSEVDEIELIDNKITALGCEFFANILMDKECKLKCLTLDHNPIKSKGVEELSKGICMNNVLESLSLNYCLLEADACNFLQEIVIYVNSALSELSLQGNNIQNEGAIVLFKSLKASKNIEKINLADNHIIDTPDLMLCFEQLIRSNTGVRAFNIRFNNFLSSGERLVGLVTECKHIYEMQLDEKQETEICTKLMKALKGRKKKKKGKKGKKGKKKK